MSRFWWFGVAPAALAALLVGGAAAPLVAQQAGRIEGTVTDARMQQPLSNATVQLQGTRLGTSTNESGRFTILNVPAGRYTVQVRRIGYGGVNNPVTVEAGQTAAVNAALSEVAVSLEQIVVTGTAIQSRAKEVGNSLQIVNSEQFENQPVDNPQDVLAGRVPSVTVMTNSGQPGAGGTVKIRGTNTISQSIYPLIYVDGVRIYNEPVRANFGSRTAVSPLQNINAEDIERIEVVKGAAATTLYGTEAAGGVLQIFTKKGLAGRPQWSTEVTTGVNSSQHWGQKGDPTNLYVDCGNTDQMYGLILSGDDAGKRQYFVDPTCPSDGDWTQPGAVQRYDLSVRGGSERVTYFASGNYGDERGILPSQHAKDGGFRANLTFLPQDQLQFQLNTAYTHRNADYAGDGNNSEGFLLNVGRGYRGYNQGGKSEADCAGVADSVVCVTNGYVFDQTLTSRTDNFLSGLTLQYTPRPNFSNRVSVGWDYTDLNGVTNLPFGFITNQGGYFWDENTRHTKLSLEYAGSLQNTLLSLASTFSVGGQIFRDNHRWTEVDVQGFSGPVDPTIGTGAQLTFRDEERLAQTSAGFFLQEQLGWQDRLFVTGGLRVDGNSAFGENFGLQLYPKLSLSYVLSDYGFWPQWWETFKLRTAIGESGRAPSPFAKLRTWQSVSGNEGDPGVSPENVGNADVGPERTRELELGLDASVLDGRLGVEATVFQARTYEALVPRLLPPSEGFLERRFENVGTLRNRGLELQLTGGVVRTSNVDLQLRANLSFLDSETGDLDNGDPEITSIPTGLGGAGIREGYAVPSYFGRRIMNPNAIADPVIVADTLIGVVYPNRLFGFGATLRLAQRVTLDALVEHQGGHQLPNFTAYQNARRGVWQPCYATQEKLIAAANGDATALDDVTARERGRCSIDEPDSDFWTEKADFTKLRYISLTYDLPQRLVGGRAARVTLSGRNLFTWTDYHGADPEVLDFADQANTGGTTNSSFGRRDYYQIPSPRTFLVSFRVGF